MNLLNYKKSVLSWRMLFEVGKQFLVILGILSIFIDIIAIEWPGSLKYGWEGFAVIILLSIISAVVISFPSKNFSIRFSYPDTIVSIKVGDIFDQEGHLVLGFSDTFDTEIGRIICRESVQGQFLERVYNNDVARLDGDLTQALSADQFVSDNSKTVGKNKRYKVGTTAVLAGESRKYFCCAYSKMGSDLKACSDINNLWILDCLWAKVRLEGEQKKIFMPVVGTNLSRVPGVSYSLPIKLLILSFIVNSRIEPISKDLTIVINDQDMEKVDLLEIKDYIESFTR